MTEEGAFGPLGDTCFPDEKVAVQEVDEYRALEGDDRGYDVLSHVTFEQEVRTQPKHHGIYHGTQEIGSNERRYLPKPFFKRE